MFIFFPIYLWFWLLSYCQKMGFAKKHPIVEKQHFHTSGQDAWYFFAMQIVLNRIFLASKLRGRITT